VKKMAIAVIAALSFLMIFAAAAPVFAAPAQKVDFTIKGAPLTSTTLYSQITPSGILYTEVSFTGHLFLPTGTTIFSSNTPVTGILREIININTGKGVVFTEFTWYLTGGNFVGFYAGKVDGLGPTAALNNLNGVLQGTGNYEGWTIIIDGSKPSGLYPISWTGTILIP